MVSIINGSNIQSPNINAGRQYVDGRRIDNLEKVGAVTTAEADVLRRADGIIDSQPVDHKPQVAELVRLEQPNYAAALFPAERQLQPGLWSHLEWDPVPAAVAAPQIPNLNSLVNDITTSPAALDFSLQLPISSLSQPLRNTARRIQLVHNNDTQANTISLPDVDQAIAAPGRFTPQEANDFKAIQKEIRAAAHTNVNDRAQVEVPRPGRSTITLQHPGQVTLRLQSVTELTETRTRSVESGRSTQHRFSVNIQLDRKWNKTVEVPPNSDAILIALNNGSEKHYPAGTHSMDLQPGTYRVEMWQNGSRVESSEVEIPPTKDERVPLSGKPDYDFVMPNGTALNRNIVRAEKNVVSRTSRQESSTVQYNYWINAQPPQNVSDPNAPTAVESPKINLPAGTYQVDPNVTVDVFAQGVMRVNIGNDAATMIPYLGSNGAAFSRATRAGQTMTFDYSRNEIRIPNRNHNRPIRITPDMRIG